MRGCLIAWFLSILLLAGLSASAQMMEDTRRLALLNHPSLEQMRVEIDLAREDLLSARSGRSIQVSATLSSALQSVESDRAFAIGSGDTFLNQAQIEAVLPLYTSGELTATIEQARLLVEASEAAYRASEQSLLLSATVAHLDVIEARETVSIREKNTARLEQQRRAAEDRFEIGVITRTDVALSEARYQAARAGLAAAEAQRDAARARYVELTGVTPDFLVYPTEAAALPPTLEEAVSLARTDNPTLDQLRLLEEVSLRGEQVARSQRQWKVEAFGSAGVQDGSWDNNYRDTSATVGVRASVPLYSGGALLSAERQAIKRTEQSRLQTQLTENQLLRDLSSAWAETEASRLALGAAQKEVEAAEIALEGAQIELDVGLRTTLDLLDQEQDLLDAQLRLISSRKNLYISESRILALMGRLGVSDKPY